MIEWPTERIDDEGVAGALRINRGRSFRRTAKHVGALRINRGRSLEGCETRGALQINGGRSLGVLLPFVTKE